MALDSSGDSSAMFGSKIESSSLGDEDLEDGEIASDEDEGDEPIPKREEPKEIKKPEPVIASPVIPKPVKPDKPSQPPSTEDNDFEKDLQKLKEEVERKKESRRDAKKRREGERDNNNKNRRKRRASDDNDKNRKEKRRKGDGGGKNSEKSQDEEMDDDEMLGLNIRGASPTLDFDKVEIWPSKQPIMDPNWQFDDNSENESDFDDRDDRKRRRRDKDRRNFRSNLREDREIKKRIQMKRKGKTKKDDNSDMICINFMKGNCTKGNDCFYSHAVCPPKKMELCKFYLMDCCAKRDKCLYLHDEFPCKFFHTGLKCYSGKKCKFSHDPLNSLSKDILLKHLETAPKEILGDFPRLSRDCAETMVNNKTTGKPTDAAKIPSLFDIQVSNPFGFQNTPENNDDRTTPPCSPPPNVKTSPKTKPKDQKFSQESEENNENDDNKSESGGPIDFAKELEDYKNKQIQNKSESSHKTSDDIKKFDAMAYFSNSLSSRQPEKPENRSDDEEKPHRRHRKHKDESGEAESDEKEDKKRKRKHDEKHKKRKEDGKSDDEHRKSKKERRSSKRETPERSGNSPVRLTEDGTFGGIKFKIINRKEIRKSSDSEKERDLLLPMKIEKPNEFLSSDDEKPLNYFITKKNDKKKEEDEDADRGFEEEEKFGVEVKQDVEDETDECENENKLVIEDEVWEDEKPEPAVPKHLPKKQQELFMRIQAQQHQKSSEDEERGRKDEYSRERKTSIGSGTGSDAEVGRTPSPEPADENWYSSDDDDGGKKESPLNIVLKNLNNEKKPMFHQNAPTDTRSHTPPPKPKIEITALNDLSKINITELLSSIRQVTSKSSSNTSDATLKPSIVPPSTSYEPPKVENSIKMNYFNSEPEKKDIKDPRLRDPRTNLESKMTPMRRTSEEKPFGKSIYDSANFKFDSHDSDLRFQSKSDSDERIKSLESIVPFGDVDLRTLGPGHTVEAGKDFDMRKFELPFKPVPVHTAATEIDASLNSHPPISYKLDSIDIPVPDFSALKISPNDPQVKKDPRLRRLFRINSTDSDPKEELKKSGLPTDPRQRKNISVADTPKSPTESPFSPKQNEQQQQQQNLLGNNQNLISANLLLLAQLGLSAAAGTTVFDPRLQQLLGKNPQELEMLRSQLSNIKSQSDFDLFRAQLMNNENPDILRTAGTGLLPTPMAAPGMGLLGPAPGFMMPGIGMPDPSVMMQQINPMANNPLGFDPRIMQNPGNNVGGNDEDMNDNDQPRHFNRGFRNDRRGRGNWRGNRDRNWDRDRRHKRDDGHRNRHNRDRDDRRERKRSSTPD